MSTPPEQRPETLGDATNSRFVAEAAEDVCTLEVSPTQADDSTVLLINLLISLKN